MSDIKVKISDICNSLEANKIQRISDEFLPFVALTETISGKLIFEVCEKKEEDEEILCAFFPKKDIDVHYLCAVLNNLDLSWKLKDKSSLSICFQDFQDEDIFLLALDQQKKIAEILSPIQKVIKIRKAQIKTCNQLIKTLFIRKFGDFLPDDTTSDENWKKLGDLFKEVTPVFGRNVPRSSDGTISIFFIKAGTKIRCIVPPPESIRECMIGLWAECNMDEVEPFFLAKSLEMPYFTFMFNHADRYYSSHVIFDFKVFCPTLDSQRQFLQEIEPIRSFIKSLEENITNWELLYKSCIQKYLP